MKQTDYLDMLGRGTTALILNILLNNYAAERVAFGFEKPGDKVPADMYLNNLQLQSGDVVLSREYIPGCYIDKQGRISIELDYDEYVREIFVLHMRIILIHASKDIHLKRKFDDIPLRSCYREYVLGILPLFYELMKIDVKYDAFDIIPMNKAVRTVEYPKWKNFVTAILFKHMKAGKQINRYVKDFTNAPHYVSRLIEKKGDNFYLKSIDISSYEYAFALFSLIKFMDDEHVKLLELKMLEWERRHKSK